MYMGVFYEELRIILNILIKIFNLLFDNQNQTGKD